MAGKGGPVLAIEAMPTDGEDDTEDMGGDRIDAAQRVLDAVKSGDAQAVDSALMAWCDLYQAGDEED